MDLSPEVLESLQVAANTAIIPDEKLPVLLDKTLESILCYNKRGAISEEESLQQLECGALKQAHFGLSTLLLEAAKCDKDTDTVGHVLEDCKFSPDRIQAITNKYKDCKEQLRILLSSTGNSLPHIVDVNWRLDHLLKNNHLEKVAQPTYLVQLKTEHCGVPESKDVQMSCTQEQLQDLVGKLKDACKSMERAAQM